MRSFFRRTRVRLTVAVGAVFLVIAGAAAGIFWIAFLHVQYGAIDSSLSAYTQSLSAGLQDSSAGVSLQGGDQTGETQQGIAIGALLIDAQDRVLDQNGVVPPPNAVAGLARRAIAAKAPLVDTVAWPAHTVRALATPIATGRGYVALVTSRPVGELQQTLTEIGMLLIGIVALLTVVVIALAYLLAGRALRPVLLIAATARDISERDLHRRVELDLPQDELGELASTFNTMLSRLEVAFDSLQQFTADAAHELRAPLTLIQAELEVSLRRARTPRQYQDSLRIALTEVEHLAGLLNQLLTLAQADAGALQATLQPIDLRGLVEETVGRWRQLAAGKHVAIDVDGSETGIANADPVLLRRLLDNLLDNAVRHTPSGGRVLVNVGLTEQTCQIAVSDTGSGIPASLRASIFDRFTRGDPARTRETGGTGLGLALCRVIAELHGGSIAVEDGAAPGAAFIVRLPRSRPPA